MDFNTPEVVARRRRPSSARRRKIGYTFNWFYADAEHIAYFNSGNNPVRADRRQPRLPGRRRSTSGAAGTRTPGRRASPPSTRTRRPSTSPTSSTGTTSRRKAYRSSDDNAYSSTYRSVLLEDRVKQGIAGDKKMTLPQLIDAMEVAGTERPARVGRPAAGAAGDRQADATRRCATPSPSCAPGAATAASGATTTATASTSTRDAIRIMDAWWPRWVEAQFEPGAGRRTRSRRSPRRSRSTTRRTATQGLLVPGLLVRLREQGPAHRARRARAREVLARVLRHRCKRCRAALRRSLAAALKVPAERGVQRRPAVQGRRPVVLRRRPQRPIGGATQPLIHWINRPTYQQANEIQKRLPR